MTVTTSPTVAFADIDPTDHTMETLIAESLRLMREADRAHAAGMKVGPSTFRPDNRLYSGVLNQDQALLYAAHTREQASTLALLALAQS